MPLDEISDPVPTGAPNRIVVTFADDHTVNGAKIEIAGVSPEQIAVAVFHLERVANSLANAAQIAARDRRVTAATPADVLAFGKRRD